MTETRTVGGEWAGQRLDHALVALFPDRSRAKLQALLRDGALRVEGAPARAGTKLRGGERIDLEEPEPRPSGMVAQDIPLDILFEDEALLVLNKPAGLVIHPGAGNADSTLANALLHHCAELSAEGGEDRPGIVHRLDKETSGCVVVAKQDAVHRGLAEQFAGREVWKVYLAWVQGIPRIKRDRIETPIDRHPVHRQRMRVAREGFGREARTDYCVRAVAGAASLVECRLHTGRTHQIRVHMKSVGHPVLGDVLYGKRGDYPRQMLHAWQLGFTHPTSGERLRFTSPWPEDFGAIAPPPADLAPGFFAARE